MATNARSRAAALHDAANTSNATPAQSIADLEIDRNTATAIAHRNALYSQRRVGDFIAKVIAIGTTIVSTTPYSIG